MSGWHPELPAARLEDRASITEQVIRYAVAVDRRDWKMLADCFTDPVHANYSENGLPAADFARDDLIRVVRDDVSGFSAMQHPSSNHVIEFDGSDLYQPTYLYDLAANGRIPVVDLDLVKFDRLDPEHPRIGLDAGGP